MPTSMICSRFFGYFCNGKTSVPGLLSGSISFNRTVKEMVWQKDRDSESTSKQTVEHVSHIQ